MNCLNRHSLNRLFQVKYEYITVYWYLTCLGGYRERETPGPIPNPEAKPLFADNTAGFTCGNVGRCLVCLFYLLLLLLNLQIQTLFFIKIN